MSNLKDAPIFLTPQVTRGCLGISAPRNMAMLEVEGTVSAGAPISNGEFAAKIDKVRLKAVPPIAAPATSPIQNHTIQDSKISLPTPKGAGSHAPEPASAKQAGSGVINWMEARKIKLDGAIRFLKSKCILVDISDRSSSLPKYRVSGNRYPLFAEEVVEIAIAKGWNETVMPA